MILGGFQRFFRVPNFWWSTDICVLLECIKISSRSFSVFYFRKKS
jgi:hypothetical protein